ncbi:heme-binding protein [Chloroflexota bacterium]
MYQKSVLGYEEASKAIDAVLKAAAKQEGLPVAVAVVDEVGSLIAYARADYANVLTTYSPINKAYTAARTGLDTATFRDAVKGQEWDISWFGDDRMMLLPGGIPVFNSDGAIVGAIGVGGRISPDEDQELAKVGLEALGL